MNYITEINRFYDWLETNDIPKSAVALWNALMHINNKAEWKESFEVAVSTLEFKTKFKRSELFEARNILTQKGRITWRQRGGNLCATYTVIPFCVRNTDAIGYTKAYTNPDTVPDAKPTQKGTINKLKETKLKKTKEKGAPDKPAADPDLFKNLVLEKFSDAFIPTWKKWLDYKKAQFKFQYKHEDSHRAAITELFNLCNGNEITAGAIIQQSMAQGWKGLFLEKKSADVKTDQSPGSQAAAPPVIFDTVAAKRTNEINYLYERYLEGFITVISIEHDHYNCLKAHNMVNFSEAVKVEIKNKANEHMGAKSIVWSKETELAYMKKFGVLEYFSQLKNQGKTIVFDHDHRK